MRKALLIDIEDKKTKQLNQTAKLQPKERLDFLIQLIRFSKNFIRTNKGVNKPWGPNTFTLVRKR